MFKPFNYVIQVHGLRRDERTYAGSFITVEGALQPSDPTVRIHLELPAEHLKGLAIGDDLHVALHVGPTVQPQAQASSKLGEVLLPLFKVFTQARNTGGELWYATPKPLRDKYVDVLEQLLKNVPQEEWDR